MKSYYSCKLLWWIYSILDNIARNGNQLQLFFVLFVKTWSTWHLSSSSILSMICAKQLSEAVWCCNESCRWDEMCAHLLEETCTLPVIHHRLCLYLFYMWGQSVWNVRMAYGFQGISSSHSVLCRYMYVLNSGLCASVPLMKRKGKYENFKREADGMFLHLLSHPHHCFSIQSQL